MKKRRVPHTTLVIFLIFIFFFIIGNISVRLKYKKAQEKSIQENKISSVSSKSEKVLDNIEYEDNKSKKENIKCEESTIIPQRMLFPCGEKILNDYSQNVVYSKTMDDWRAHTGIDYEAQIGTDVICVWDGTVTKVYQDVLWGNTVEIMHPGEITSKYKCLDENISVKKGDFVKGGQVIGKIGDSASVESREKSHLHFELWTNNVPINPSSYIY